MKGGRFGKFGSILVVVLMVLTALAVIISVQPSIQAKQVNSQGIQFLYKDVHINVKDLKYVTGPNGEKYIVGKGMRELTLPGDPAVPVKIISFTLPAGAKNIRVNLQSPLITSYGKMKVSPAPAPVLKSGKTFPAKFSPPKYNEKVYGSNKFYPEKNYDFTVSKTMDKTIVNVYIYPVKYNPVTNEVNVMTHAKVVVSYSAGTLKSGSAPIDVPNIIITSPQLKAAAQKLADFHNSTGVTSWVVTTSWIAKNYQPAANPPVNGYANATTDPYGLLGGQALPLEKNMIIGYNYTLAKKIIAFLQNESYGNNVEYITIFGNARMVPPSYYWTDQYGYLLAYYGLSDMYDAWIPTDAFYAQPNYNSTYFSYEPEFFIGRIPVNPLTANKVVDKIIYYATHKTAGIENVTLSGGQVFETPYFLGETGVLEPLNMGWLDGAKITEYFHTLRNYTYNNFIKMMYNSDMIIEITHGSGFSFWHHNDEVSAWDFSMNSSYGSLPIYISGSCLNGAWDEEVYPSEFASGINGGTSIAEKMLYAPDGIIAYYGGDREAYGSTYAYFDNGTLVAPNDFGDLITEDGTVAGYFLAMHYYGYATLGMMYSFALSLYNYWLGPYLRMLDPWDTGMNMNIWARSYFEYSLLGDPALVVSGNGASYPSYNAPNVIIPNAVYNSNDEPVITRGEEVSVNISTDSPTVKVELLYLEHGYGSGPWGAQPTYYDFILDMKTLHPVATRNGINNFTYSFVPHREGTYILSVYSADGKNTRFYMSCGSPAPPLSVSEKEANYNGRTSSYSTGGPAPDVQVVTLLDYGDVAFGKTTNVTAVLYNSGNATATNITVHFYLENYVLIFQEGNLSHPLVWLGNATVSSLAPGEVAYVTIPWKAVNLIPLGMDPTNSSVRWQYVVASADVAGDSNPDNNAMWALFHVHLPLDVWVQKVFIQKDPVVGEPNSITFEITNIGTSDTATSNVTVMDYYSTIKTVSVTLAPGETKFITVPWIPQVAGEDIIEVVANTPGDQNPRNDVSFYYPNGYWSIATFKVLSYDVEPVMAYQSNDNLNVELYNFGPLASKGTTVDLWEIENVNTIDVESPHPYPNNYDNVWTITVPNATKISLHFNYLYVEPGWDYVYIYNSTGKLQISYTGFYNDLWTPFINGSTVYVELVSDESVNYTGFYIDAYATGISQINSVQIGAIASGNYVTASVSLGNTTAGVHYYKIVTNTPGESATLTTGGATNDIIYQTINVKDTIAPQIESFHLANSITNDRSPALNFTWYDEIYSGFSDVNVQIDGITIPASVIANGNSGNVVANVPFLLADGKHTVQITLVDNGGNKVTESWTFTVDATPPTLEITSSTNTPITYTSTFWINGTTEPGAKVTINGVNVPVDSNGNFAYETTLVNGENVFIVKATDEAGNTATETVTALYLPQIPEILNAINNLNSEISNLQSQITSMKDEISDIQGKISNIQGDISAINNDINAMKSQLNTLNSRINMLQNELKDNVTALNKAIQELNTTLVNKIEQNIDDLQSQINDLKDQANDLQSNIQQINSNISNINEKNKKQDNSINSANAIGYAGLSIGIVAIIIAIVAVAAAARKNRGKKEAPEENKEEIEESTEETEEGSEEEKE